MRPRCRGSKAREYAVIRASSKESCHAGPHHRAGTEGQAEPHREHDRRGTPEHRELGMDVRFVGRCLLPRHRLVRVGSQRVGLAGHCLNRGHCYRCHCFLEGRQSSEDHPGPGNRFHLDCLGNFDVSALSNPRREWKTDRSASLCGRDIGHAWHGQRSLSPDSSLEGSDCVRSRVVGGRCGYVLWHRCAEHDRVSDRHLSLPDRVRHLRGDRRSAGAQTARSNPCLICPSSIPWCTAGCDWPCFRCLAAWKRLSLPGSATRLRPQTATWARNCSNSKKPGTWLSKRNSCCASRKPSIASPKPAAKPSLNMSRH